MELLIRTNFDIFQIPAYNCSVSNKEIILVSQPLLAVFALLFAIFVYSIYIPCMIVMRCTGSYDLSCYKIMFALGFTDLLSVGINGFFAAYLLIVGSEFCTDPIKTVIIGSVGLGCWCCACYLSFILVTNRLLDIMGYNSVMRVLFKYPWLTVLPGFLYGFYATFFTPPPLYSTAIAVALWDPGLYPPKTYDYKNYIQEYNNLGMVSATCLLYGTFCVGLYQKFREVRQSGVDNKRIIQIKIFLQASIICFCNFIAAISYILIQHSTSWFLKMFAQLMWQSTCAAPAITYLCLNNTIRRGVLALITRDVSELEHKTWNPYANLKNLLSLAEVYFQKKRYQVSFTFSHG